MTLAPYFFAFIFSMGLKEHYFLIIVPIEFNLYFLGFPKAFRSLKLSWKLYIIKIFLTKEKILILYFSIVVLQQARVMFFTSSFEMPFNYLEIILCFELFGFFCAKWE